MIEFTAKGVADLHISLWSNASGLFQSPVPTGDYSNRSARSRTCSRARSLTAHCWLARAKYLINPSSQCCSCNLPTNHPILTQQPIYLPTILPTNQPTHQPNNLSIGWHDSLLVTHCLFAFSLSNYALLLLQQPTYQATNLLPTNLPTFQPTNIPNNMCIVQVGLVIAFYQHTIQLTYPPIKQLY